MLKYILKKNNNESSTSSGNFFAYPVKDKTVDIDELAQHMANHNTPFSAGAVKGILTDMVGCIRELLLDGKAVKIKDLAIFSIGIKNKKGGSATADDFNVAQNIEALRMRARGTGTLLTKNIEAAVKKAEVVDFKKKNAKGALEQQQVAEGQQLNAGTQE